MMHEIILSLLFSSVTLQIPISNESTIAEWEFYDVALNNDKCEAIAGISNNTELSMKELQILNITDENVKVYAGDSTSISVIMNIHPRKEYSVVWRQMRFLQDGTISESTKKGASLPVPGTNGTQEEKIFIKEASYMDMGRYKLEIWKGRQCLSKFAWIVQVLFPTQEVSVDYDSNKVYEYDNCTYFVLYGFQITINISVYYDYYDDMYMRTFVILNGTRTEKDIGEIKEFRYLGFKVFQWSGTPLEDFYLEWIDEVHSVSNSISVRRSGIFEVGITRYEKDGQYYLSCNLPMFEKYIVYWIRASDDGNEDEIIDLYEPNIDGCVQKFAVNIRDFSKPWGAFECTMDPWDGEEHITYVDKVEEVPKKIIILLTIVGIVVSALMASLLLLIIRQRKHNHLQRERLKRLYEQMTKGEQVDCPEKIDDSIPLHERINQLPYDQKFEIQREMIAFEKMIGCGEFGAVYLCQLSKPSADHSSIDGFRIRVAAKRPRNRFNAEHFEALAAELRMMIALGTHPNVLCLIGAVVKLIKKNYLYVIYEYCELGDLRGFVSKNEPYFVNEIAYKRRVETEDGYMVPRGDVREMQEYYQAQISPEWDVRKDEERAKGLILTTSDLLSFAYQIANGMSYLASIMCIHRDLAARNVLVTKNRIIRIADFGLARKDKAVYKMKSDARVPIRWMSPEAINQKLFSEKSDIWSYGVLLWELFTFGKYPYHKFEDNNVLYDLILNGYQLEKPKSSPAEVYSIMKKCWLFEPSSRPNFMDCKMWVLKELKKASPNMASRVKRQLKIDVKTMDKYAEFREVRSLQPSSERAEAGRITQSNAGSNSVIA